MKILTLKSLNNFTIKVSKRKFLDELRKQFILEIKEFYHNTYVKITDEAEYVSNFEDDMVKLRFANKLAEYFEEKVEEKVKKLRFSNLEIPQIGIKNTQYGISGTSLLNNYLKPNKLSDAVKDSTLLRICLFLGYNDFNDFQNKNTLALQPFLVKQCIFYPYRIVLFLLFILVLCYLKTGAPSDQQIKSTIITANKIEFDSYKKLKLTDSLTTLIDRYWAKHIARERILNIIKKHPIRGRILIDTLNSSQAKILNIDVVFKSRYYTRVETEESWKLIWFNTKLKIVDASYDRIDNQVYELVIVDGKLKIFDNWHIKKPLDIKVSN